MSMILAVMYREFRIRITSFVWMFFDLFMPLIYLLLFGVGLDKAISGGITVDGMSVNYQTFFLAGVLSMACFGIAINTSYGFFVDRDNGIFYEFLTYPMTRGQFLVGKIVFNCLLAIAQSGITISAAVWLLGIPIEWRLIWFVFAGIVFGTAGWFFFLSMLALRITRSDVYNTVLNVAYFVMMFASSMFYPTETMPAWLRSISLLNPLTWHTDALRYGVLGVGNVEFVALEAAGFGVFLLISFYFAVRSLQHPVMK